MMNIIFRNAPRILPAPREETDAMIADWIARNGEPRRFDRGFSGEWFNLKSIMLRLGYEISIDRRFYIVQPIGAKGRPKRLTREAALNRIDEILITHGKQPFLRRQAA